MNHKSAVLTEKTRVNMWQNVCLTRHELRTKKEINFNEKKN